MREGKREAISQVCIVPQESLQSVKAREGYVKGNVKLFVGPYCFSRRLAVRGGPWRVREGKREGRNTEVKNPQSVKVREGYVKRNVKQICTSLMSFLGGFSV